MNIVERFKKIWSRKWGRRAVVVSGIGLLLILPLRCDGPYKGRVLDQATGRPIAAAVAVASWSYTSANIGGGTTHCLDAAEAVTDKNGEFRIPGRHGALFGTLGNMRIAVYKVGYRRVGCSWKYLHNPGSCFDEPGEFDGDRAIIPLEKVPMEKFDSSEGRPPHLSCGRRDKKTMSAWRDEIDEYYDMLRKLKKGHKLELEFKFK